MHLKTMTNTKNEHPLIFYKSSNSIMGTKKMTWINNLTHKNATIQNLETFNLLNLH